MINISISMLLICILMPTLIAGLNWQAQGNFSVSNISIITTKITDLKGRITFGSINITYACIQLSDYLNNLWNIAWNVAIIVLDQSSTGDAICYGYAFNDHWMWINDRTDSHLGFIIWKDYNCNNLTGWNTYTYGVTSNNVPSNYINFMNIYHDAYLTDNPLKRLDPWAIGYALVQYANINILSGIGAPTAWSIIAWSSMSMNQFSARFCSFYYSGYRNYMHRLDLDVKYLMFRTR